MTRAASNAGSMLASNVTECRSAEYPSLPARETRLCNPLLSLKDGEEAVVTSSVWYNGNEGILCGNVHDPREVENPKR